MCKCICEQVCKSMHILLHRPSNNSRKFQTKYWWHIRCVQLYNIKGKDWFCCVFCVVFFFVVFVPEVHSYEYKRINNIVKFCNMTHLWSNFFSGVLLLFMFMFIQLKWRRFRDLFLFRYHLRHFCTWHETENEINNFCNFYARMLNSKV